jgi:hypothetical protein
LYLSSDASLADFAAKHVEAFPLCLNQIAAARIRISFTGALSPELRTTLAVGGARVSAAAGQTLVEYDFDLPLQKLRTRAWFVLGSLPPGAFSGRTIFLDAAGAELGFIG